MIAQGQKTIVDLTDPIQQGTAPVNPVEGLLWLDTSQSPLQLKRWSGTEWEFVNEVEVGATNLASRTVLSHHGTCDGTVENYTYSLTCTAASYNSCGVKIDAGIFETGKNYVLSFKTRKTSGTLVGVGGHSTGFSTVKVLCDDAVIGASWSSGISLPNDTQTHSIAVYLIFNGGAEDDALYIQPNRGFEAASGAYAAQIWDIQVERGTVATDWAPAPEDVQENVEQQLTDTRSQITSTAAAIRQEVEANYAKANDLSTVAERLATISEQTDSNFTWTVQQLALLQGDSQTNQAEIENQLRDIMSYMTFDTSGQTIGKTGSPVTVHVGNDRLSFKVNGGTVAYFSDNRLYVENGEFLGSLKLGRFAFTPQENGNLSFVRV